MLLWAPKAQLSRGDPLINNLSIHQSMAIHQDRCRQDKRDNNPVDLPVNVARAAATVCWGPDTPISEFRIVLLTFAVASHRQRRAGHCALWTPKQLGQCRFFRF